MRLLACFAPAATGALGRLRDALGHGHDREQPHGPSADPCFAFHIAAPRPDLGWAAGPDGSTVIVDGEVFALPDGSTPTDAGEAAGRILDLYLAQGDGVLAQVNSAAAITIWDASNRRLTIARDRSGLGLCYLMEQDGALFWASDIATLIGIDPRTELDAAAVDNLLAGGFIPAPWTSLAHIRKVPAAHKLVSQGGTTAILRYWWPETGPKRSWSERGRRELDQLIERAARRRLPDGRKAAMLLSGGVDSMLMLAYLTRRCGAAIDAFTFRYGEYEGVFNEGSRARRAAEYCGVAHREILVRPRDLVRRLDRILLDHNGPMTYGAHSSLLREIAAENYELLYGGHAADSFFYSRSEEQGLRLRRWPRPVAALLGSGAPVLRRLDAKTAGRLGYAARVARTGLTWRFHSPLTSEAQRASLYADPDQMRRGRAAAADLYSAEVARFEDWPECDRLPLAMQRFYTPENALHWTQSFARANGMSARCPYADNDLVDYIYALRRSGGSKDELRSVAAMVLPRELASAPKLGQTLPLADWFRGPLAGFVRDHLGVGEVASHGLFRAEAVGALLDRHISGAANHVWTIWTLISLLAWSRLVRSAAGTRRVRSVAAE